MNDTQQEEIERANDAIQDLQQQASDDRASVLIRIDALDNDEVWALLYLMLCFGKAEDPNSISRKRRAIDALMGVMTVGEWSALAPMVKLRHQKRIDRIMKNRKPIRGAGSQ